MALALHSYNDPLRYEPGTIVFSRPVHELWAHITNCQLPSWALIARAIATLFLGIFKWHLCDGILLLRREALYHSFDGNAIRIPASVSENSLEHSFDEHDFDDFNERYPHLLQQALYMRPNHPPTQAVDDSLFDHAYIGDDLYGDGDRRQWILMPRIGLITPQHVHYHFEHRCGILISDVRDGSNTISSLVHSDKLVQTSSNVMFDIYMPGDDS